MSLPGGWEVVPPVQQSGGIPRFYYRKQSNPPISQWTRPFAPPGYEGNWPTIIHCAHILLKHKECKQPLSHNKRKRSNYSLNISKEQALKEIRKIRDTVIDRSSTDPGIFSVYAERKSDCGSYSAGGDLKWTKIGKLQPAFEKAALQLKCGEISEPTLSPSGWHIIKRLDVTFGISPPNPPPPPELELDLRPDTDLRTIQLIYNLMYNTEIDPTNSKNWMELINTYLSATHEFTRTAERFLRGLLHFHPGDFQVISFCLEKVKEQRQNKFVDEIYGTVLLYTWDPNFWRMWMQDQLSRIPTEDRSKMFIKYNEEMLGRVGFTVNCATLWVQYIGLLKEANAPTDFITMQLEKALSIGLDKPNKLLDYLDSYLPEKRQFYEEKIQANKKIVERRLKRLQDIKNGMVKGESDKRLIEWQIFLREELNNELELPEELFCELVDYNYRFALSVLWWLPSIWMEYWSFLIKNNKIDHADAILRLGRKSIGNTPLFELKRVEHLIKYEKYDEAKEILEKLIKSQEPLRTSALTLLFKATSNLVNEEEALHVISNNLDKLSPQFLINAAKLCENKMIAWSIFQRGVDMFPDDDSMVIAAAEFLEKNRDVRNTRSLFQQSLDDKTVRFEIQKRLYEFELERNASLDHLNETQKVFKKSDVDPFILYMQRYRFLDLYPYDLEDLKVIAHLSKNVSIDLIDRQDYSGYITSMPPMGANLSQLKRNDEWLEESSENLRRATTIEQTLPNQQGPLNVKKRMPQEVHHLYRDIQNCQIHFQPPSVDEVINRILGFTIQDPHSLVRQY
ncbi:ess1p [Histomonas meleagridis]|uniref:ess1p n=1 Tax=Histomonas meleagridis TaxID=135588 RepID=UPI003559F76C|nr:ess1p [Histomonas meleagridis]KAH0802534.1 ess1p [Histomonas meleagridis]